MYREALYEAFIIFLIITSASTLCYHLSMKQTWRTDKITTVNMLHYTFVKNTFGFMSQVPCYLTQCQVSEPAISKQTDVLAAIAGV